MSQHRPITVAVVGLGRAGWDIHVARMRDCPRFRLVAVADTDPDRRQQTVTELGCEAFADYRELLRRSEAEVVVVASYTDSHAPIALAALSSDRHVIVDKPMATTLSQGRKMVAAADKGGKRLFVHHNTRFYPDSRHVLDVVRDGRIGEVFAVRIRLLSFDRRNDWQTLRAHGGGLLSNWGSHYVDMALQLLSSPVKELFCDLKLVSDAGDAEDHVKVILRAENGRVVDLEISTACAFEEPKWTLLGTHGTLMSDGTTSTIRRFDPRKLTPMQVYDGPAPGRIYASDPTIPWETQQVPSVGKSVGDLYDNVWDVLRRGKPMIVTPEEALEVLRVIELCKRMSGFY